MSVNKWTIEEDNFLKDNLNKMSIKEMASIIDRTESAIKTRRRIIGATKENIKLDDIKEQIIEDYQNGMTLKQLQLKYNNNNIHQKLKRWEVFKPINKRWTKEEIQYLKNNYANESWDILLINLKRFKKETIGQKASKLRLKRQEYFWTEEEEKILDKYYDKKTCKELYTIFEGRHTETAISVKANKMGLNTRLRWTDEEIEIMNKNYENSSMEDMISLLNRTKTSIISMAMKLNLRNEQFWGKEEDKILKENYRNMNDVELSELLDRSSDSIRGRRQRLKLFKPTTNNVSKGYIDEDGVVFNSKIEFKVFKYIQNKQIFKHIIQIGNNRYKKYNYHFENTFFCPDYIIKDLNINSCTFKLKKPLIIEYYGLYNLKKIKWKIIKMYVDKTDKKERFYKSNKDIYYIGIFPDDLKNNFEGLNNKLDNFLVNIGKKID